MERLRRWHRELRARDVLATPAAHAADQGLKACATKLEDYTTRVFQALNEGLDTGTTMRGNQGRLETAAFLRRVRNRSKGT